MRLRQAALLSIVTSLWPAAAAADIQHVVGRGHTIEAIANRYHVTVKAIIEANHLKNVKQLHPGDVLTIPKADTPPTTKAKPEEPNAGPHKAGDKSAKVAGKPTRETTTFAARPKTPGIVHLKRLATNEELEVRVESRRGKVAPGALHALEKMMRSPSGMSHPIDARLAALVGVVSNHFGSRNIEVVSGFRPYTPTQYTPHSNHNHGKAIDFRVVGVPNEVVRDFCRTLKNVGCGYYPNSTFVHMDVRPQSAFWIDYSRPGEPPRYNAPNVEADEGTSDVHDEHHVATGSTPAELPAEAPKADTPRPEDTPTANPEAAPEAAPAKVPAPKPPAAKPEAPASPAPTAKQPEAPAAKPEAKPAAH